MEAAEKRQSKRMALVSGYLGVLGSGKGRSRKWAPPHFRALHVTAKTPFRTTQNQLLGLQAAKHRGEPVKTSSRPAPSPLAAHSGPPSRKTPPRTAEKQLETSSSIREAHIS